MTILLAIILYFVGFYLLAKRTVPESAAPGNRMMIRVILFFVYSCFAGGFTVAAYMSGDLGMVLYTLCLLFALVEIGNVILTVSRSRGEIKPQYAVLFILYILAILVVTLITRQTRTETVLQTELFASVKSFLLEGNVEELNHMILNVVMFMPLGYLFVQMHPRKLGDAAQVLGIGVMLSTIIESCQLIFRLGNCDVDDILANTFGALLGLVLYKIVHHSSRK